MNTLDELDHFINRIKDGKKYLFNREKVLRQLHHSGKSFKVLKWLFKFFMDGKTVCFSKFKQYEIMS